MNTRKGQPMFYRMLLRAAMRRKRSAIAALLAIVVAAAASTAMLNISLDAQSKLQREFRGFGANIVVKTKSGQSFTADELQHIESTVGSNGLAVPFAYAIARNTRDEPIVVAGTDLVLARKLNPWWSVTSWPEKSGEALIGVGAARARGNVGALAFQGREVQLIPAGTVRTGAGEDSRIYLALKDFHAWTGIDPSVVEIAAYGSRAEVGSLVSKLQHLFPAAEVDPVRQITESEANILAKTRFTLLWSSVLIISTAALCVLATLTGWLVDRRRDFAIMKAIGASDRLIALFISAEAALLACIGAVLGFALGLGIAAWIGRANFHASIVPRFGMLPPVIIGCVAVTLLATLLPLRLLRQIQPAMILRGE
jgi:putative ABC transport system permease protein